MSPAPKSVIPAGMGTMLKMFGLDPAEISSSISRVVGTVTDIADRLDRIEKKLDALKEEKPDGRELIIASNTVAGKNGG